MDYHDVYLTAGTLYADGNTQSNSAPATPVSAATIQSLWISACNAQGVTTKDAAIAAQIAEVESSRIPNVVAANDSNGQGGTQASWGLFQFSNGTHAAPFVNWSDPATNVAHAVSKYHAAGDTFARDWAGSYAKIGGGAQEQPGSTSNPWQEVSNVVNEGEEFIIGGVEAIGKDILGAAEGAGNFLLAPLRFTAGAIAAVSNIFENFGVFIVGIMLLLIGGFMLAQAHRDTANEIQAKGASALDNLAQAAQTIAGRAAKVVEEVPVE